MKRYLSAICLFFGVVWLAACGSSDGGNDGNPPNSIEDAPVVDSFTADPNSGNVPLETTFSWQISDPNNEALTCTLNFGDGSDLATIENCTSSSTQPHTYREEGSYTAELTVTNASGRETLRTVTVAVGVDEPTDPGNGGSIEECTLESNNNSQDTPCRLNIGETYEGQLGTEEENDYYVFTTPPESAGVAEVLLTSIPVGQSLNFELLGANGSPIDTPFTRYTDNNPGEFFVLSPASTTYYLRVSNGGFGNTSNETYNLSVNYRADADELNENIGQATPLTFNEGVDSEEDGLTYGFTYTDDKNKDIDVYEMSAALPEGQAGVISVTLPNAPVGLTSSILNDAEQPIQDGFSNNRSTGEGTALEYNLIVDSRTLYLTLTRVSGSDAGSTTPYRLNTRLDTKDTFEPNNSDVDPPGVSLGETVEGYINGQFIENGALEDDLDYYSITRQPDQGVEVELSSVPANQSLNIQILDSNGTPISGAETTATSSNSRSVTAASDTNPSFIRIANVGRDFSANDSYTLSITGVR